MTALFVYLIKVNIALIIFCLGYYLVLRPLTFYVLNRVYLVSAILFATLYPLVDFSDLLNRHQEIAQPVQVIILNWQTPVVEAVHDKWYWMGLVFWAGVGVLAIRFAMQLLSLYKLHRQSKPVQLHQYFIRVISGDINPFSFWKNIYINPDNHEPEELKAILAHEQVHVSEWHTLDILLGEISTIFYWFNPGVWLMKRAIRENIEFITDQKILQSGSDPKAYQYSLLNVSFNGGHNAIVNHFNTSTIKKRIMMMNTKKSSPLNLTRYAFLVPAVVVLVLIFSVSKAEFKKQVTKGNAILGEVMINVADKIEPVTTNIAIAAKRNIMMLPDAVSVLFTDSAKKETPITGASIVGLPGYRSFSVTQPEGGVYTADTLGKLKEISITYNTLADTSKKLKEITVVGFAAPKENSNIQGVITRRDVMAPNGNIYFSGEPVNKAMVNGVVISTHKMTPEEMEKLKQAGTATIGPGGVIDINQQKFTNKNGGDQKSPLIIINGKLAESNRLVNLHDIEAVSVIKGEEAIAKYGDQAKNGVIDVKTIPHGTGNFGATSLVNITTGRAYSYDTGGGRVTGGIVGTETLKTRPGYVEMRDDNGNIYYHNPGNTSVGGGRTISGDRVSKNNIGGTGGRIMLNDGKIATTTDVAKFDAITVTGYGRSPNIFAGKLLIVDGKEMSQAQFSKLPADKIDVVRRASVKELAKYGDKAKNGALIITTNK